MATVDVYKLTRTLELLGETLISAAVVGNNLRLTTRSGIAIDAGVVRGSSSSSPTAGATAYSPANGIVATNVQSALAELGVDVTNLTNNKANRADLPVIIDGKVTQPATANTEVVQTHTNVFPAGVFATAPRVILTLQSTAPQNILYYGISGITTRSFTLTDKRTTSTDSVYHWIACSA